MPEVSETWQILVVDDDELDRQVIRRALRSLDDISIVEAQSGEHAMQILETISPAVVVTDIFMPNIDGLEFLTSLATSGWNFPVIAITGQNSKGYIDFLKVANSFGAVLGMEKKDIDKNLADAISSLLMEKRKSAKKRD